ATFEPGCAVTRTRRSSDLRASASDQLGEVRSGRLGRGKSTTPKPPRSVALGPAAAGQRLGCRFRRRSDCSPRDDVSVRGDRATRMMSGAAGVLALASCIPMVAMLPGAVAAVLTAVGIHTTAGPFA